MNILIVGRGWTGNKMRTELLRRNHVVHIISHTEVFRYLNGLMGKYDWIINCAGVTGTPNVDACESMKKETIEANAIFPVLLYDAARQMGSRFAHFSSGCIYQGEITSVHEEPNFFGSIYSVSKGISDSYLKDKAQVYRIRMPFTSVNETKNYLTKILKYANSGKLIEGGKNSVTDLDEAVKVACKLIESGAPDGPYNLVNQGSVTMHELVELLNINPVWYTAEEFAQVTVANRSNCTIPAYEEMSTVEYAVTKAIKILSHSSL